ncbi:Peptidase family M48 [Saccharopolyspora kobensis]|uniref:Peptidase family M48 n=1 Tax=Saccharopolyspora kobensis TaxID=146035 RepID=A0A1H6A9M5_9PSEU|nr:M56 family metallopeptidase [Saccharopolyspora kobensis]SEG45398.1 Peptidase family M48 [Saccharopolyspora kobensis]SFE52909.1 Peptidase family M48 [Saccharopolyspora kobensis]
MTPLLIGLFAYIAALAVLGPRLIRACRRWQSAAPRLGLVFWTALATSWVVAVISAGLAAMAQLSGGHGLAALLHACLRALLTIVGVHSLADAPAAIALLGSGVVIGRLLVVAARHVRRTRRHRELHRKALRSFSNAVVGNGIRVAVVEAEQLAAYCVPGRCSTVVLTTGALRRLVPAERDAVMAHEIAHLRGKHHLMSGWAAILAHAFPFVPLLKAASQEIARLVEWIADDRAGRRHGNRAVARALAVMATSPAAPVPKVALAAAGSGVPERVRRLLQPRAAVHSACWRIVAALALPVVALVAAAAVLVPCATADPTPICSGRPSLSAR